MKNRNTISSLSKNDNFHSDFKYNLNMLLKIVLRGEDLIFGMMHY